MAEVETKGVETGNYPSLFCRYLVGISNVMSDKDESLDLSLFVRLPAAKAPPFCPVKPFSGS